MRMGVSSVHAAASLLATPTSAPLGGQSHSFLDNAIASFGQIRVWNCSVETAPFLTLPCRAAQQTAAASELLCVAGRQKSFAPDCTSAVSVESAKISVAQRPSVER